MTNSTADLIAAFLATRGATVVPTGVRTTTDAQMKRAIGYTPEKEYRYEVMLAGEDGMDFCVHHTAANVAAVEEYMRKQYPESNVISVEHVGARDARIYREVSASY